MKVFIVSKEFTLKCKLVSKEYVKTFVERKSAIDHITSSIGKLCTRLATITTVKTLTPNRYIVNDYNVETGALEKQWVFNIIEVEL